MADNRTGLSPADIAESFRDRCGDGSVEWTYTPMQTWVLLDAADMLDENAKLVMKLNAEHLVRQNVERENAKLRELVHVFYHCTTSGECEWTAAGDKHHHHAPTVEDVLREFAYGLGVPVADSYLAATAAKLRLAGDE